MENGEQRKDNKFRKCLLNLLCCVYDEASDEEEIDPNNFNTMPNRLSLKPNEIRKEKNELMLLGNINEDSFYALVRIT